MSNFDPKQQPPNNRSDWQQSGQQPQYPYQPSQPLYPYQQQPQTGPSTPLPQYYPQPPQQPMQPQPGMYPQQPPPMETTVKTYNNPKEYQKDVSKMTKQGWTVNQSTEYQPDRSLAGKLFVPFGMITKPAAKIVVTYQRQAQQPNRRLTLKESIRLEQEKRRNR